MANLHLTRLVLLDKWPGVPNPNIGFPTKTLGCGTAGKGWDNTVDNFSSADDTARALNKGSNTAGHTKVRLGEKRMAYHESTDSPGWYTMMYLCLHSFEDGMDISKDFSDGHLFHSPNLTTNLCVSNTEWADTSRAPYFVVARCTTGCDFTKAGGPVAVFCSTYTYSDGTNVSANGYGDGYGWAWIGGVCPCKDITLFDDETGAGKGVEITVDGALHKGPVFLCQTGAAALLMSCDESNVNDATTGVTGVDPASLAIGWACASAA